MGFHKAPVNAEAVTPVVVHTVVAVVSLQRFLVRELFLGLRSVRHDSDDQVERFLTDTVASYIQPGRVAENNGVAVIQQTVMELRPLEREPTVTKLFFTIQISQ